MADKIIIETVQTTVNFITAGVPGLRGEKGEKGDYGINAWGEIQGNITEQTDLQEALNQKLNAEAGKGLSTNDYSNEDKTKVSKIITDGVGDKYLSDDGSYKTVSGGGGVTSVNTKTGAVVLNANDVGAYSKSESDSLLGDKADKEAGKGLSTNDYSNADKTKVSKIITDGLGDKYLSDDGSYKTVSGGGVSEANVKGWIARNIAVNNAYVNGIAQPAASHSGSISIGEGATSYGNHSIQIGKSANSKQNSVAIGANAKSDEFDAVAIGSAATASSIYAIAIGKDSQAQHSSVALGRRAINSNNTHTNCVLLGSNTVVTSANQVQLGNSQTTTYAYGTVQDRSDVRDKTDIRDIALGLDFINALRPVEYRWDYREDYFADIAPKREDFDSDEEYSVAYEQARVAFFENPVKDGSKTRTRHHTGLIAQEVKQVMDDLGVDFGGFQHHQERGGLDVMSLGYNELIAVLIKAIQELTLRIDAIENA